MKQPVHPGNIVKHDCIDALGLSTATAAVILGVSRSSLSQLIAGRAPVSAEMAVRLAKAFGGRAEAWLGIQYAFNVAQLPALRRRIRVKSHR